MSEVLKSIKINWEAPNGKPYSDIVKMSLKQYEDFVNNLLKLKKENN